MSDYCECGLADQDPHHYGWHRIWDWNRGVWADAKAKREADFDKRILPKKVKGRSDAGPLLDPLG